MLKHTVFVIFALSAPALAQTAPDAPRPHPQLVASVQMALRTRGYDVDVASLSVAQVAGIHLALYGEEYWWEKKRIIDAILLWK